MLRWTCLILVVCLGLDAQAWNSHETGIGSKPGVKRTNCPCGMSKKGRIVGGSFARQNEYPWMVLTVFEGYKDTWCGGGIVTPSVVITAAHCTHGLRPIPRLMVIAGTSDANRPGQVVPVKRWIEHEAYAMPNGEGAKTINDIALLILERPLQFNANVGPVCMPTGKYNIENQWVKLIGWGRVAYQQGFPTWLKETDVMVQPFGQCQRWYALRYPQTQICTIAKAQKTTSCNGDSGSPVTYLDPQTNRYTLVGIVSFGGFCDPNQPSVMAEVSVYINWIQSKLKTLGCHKV